MRRLAIVTILSLILFMPLSASFAATPEELKQAIDAKSKELEKITADVKQTQAQLDQVAGEKKTLNNDIKQIDYSINQLNLNIKSSGINIDKLKLELELLDDKRTATEISIDNQKEAVRKVLRELQQRDNDNLMQMLLRNNSFSDSLTEIQNLEDLQINLSVNVATLNGLHDELSKNIGETTGTKTKLEIANDSYKNRKVIAADKKSEKNNLLATTKNKESAYQKQLSDLEDKQASIGKEIGELETALRASFDPNVLPFKRSGVLAFPVLEPVFTQDYGATAFAQRAYKTGFHNGVDFKASIGTPIIAAANGSVMAVGNNGRAQYGKYVVIKHDNNLATLYSHLSRQTVTKGDYVKVGQIIGYSGNTGYVTGPHLHFTVYWAPSVTFKSFSGAGLVPIGVTVNPMDYL